VETIAFYSYKGGVGRSLLLATAARDLASLGKGVVALDFDFEAPGLHYKFFGGPSDIGGVVPYLIATADGTISPPPFEDHMISVLVPAEAGGWLRLMPAGPAPRQSYWAALKELGERLKLTDLSGRGFMALLDLQARIADELKPDYLLIDARTGVTELGGLATTVLADTVVCMFVPNSESLDGSLAVVDALKITPRLANQKQLRVVPVMSRTSTAQSADTQFWSRVSRLIALVGDDEDQYPNGVLALPHDDELGPSEMLIGMGRHDRISPLKDAYVELFKRLFHGIESA
jgi:hypothetical protein